MASIIDYTYFTGEISIPNLTGTGPIVTANLAKVNRLIDLYEKDYLIKLLGEDLYDQFVTDLGTSEAWATGLRDELRDTTLRVSPIAYYMYYFWLRESATYVTSGGQAEPKNKNSLNSSPNLRMVEAYNRMVRMTVKLLDYIRDEQSEWPETVQMDASFLRPINTFNI